MKGIMDIIPFIDKHSSLLETNINLLSTKWLTVLICCGS
jgi:hypothetical protein